VGKGALELFYPAPFPSAKGKRVDYFSGVQVKMTE
jgi:hypothetical protein